MDYKIDCNNKTKSSDETTNGYYFNDTNNKTIDKCNIKCKKCSNESNINDLCLSCNIESGYYPLINDDSNIDSYFNCYNYTPSGYAFDNFTYKPCYPTCKECITIGDDYNHQCFQCIDNYFLNNTNCIEKCTYFHYFNGLKRYCTENNTCPENKSKLIQEKGECVEDCLEDSIFKYEYNNNCLKSCKLFYVDIRMNHFSFFYL